MCCRIDEEVSEVGGRKIEHYKNLGVILDSITMLKSDKYDNALLPIALVNKNVSISDVPGSVILQKLAKTIE